MTINYFEIYLRISEAPNEGVGNQLNESLWGEHDPNLEILLHQLLVFPEKVSRVWVSAGVLRLFGLLLFSWECGSDHGGGGVVHVHEAGGVQLQPHWVHCCHGCCGLESIWV